MSFGTIYLNRAFVLNKKNPDNVSRIIKVYFRRLIIRVWLILCITHKNYILTEPRLYFMQVGQFFRGIRRKYSFNHYQ